MELRDYQKNAISEIYGNIRGGIKSQLVVAPTGSGKTVLAAKLIKDATSKNRRVLFLCHRTQLVYQTQATLAKLGLGCGLIMPGKKVDYSQPVQIAMLQTIQNRELPPDIGLVILDEAHITSYFEVTKKIFDKYSGGIYCLSKCFFLGLTATPWRMAKREGFCQFYEAVVRVSSPRQLIKAGYLTRERIYTYDNSINTDNLETDSNGELSLSALIRVCNHDYNAHIVSTFKELCPDRKAIAFCVGVKQAEDLTKQFLSEGFGCEFITGATPDKERLATYERLRAGTTQILVNVGVATEGFDEPSLSAVLLARPTRSLALALQMIGRGLRLHEDKEDCYILDFGQIINWITKKKGHADPLDIMKSPLCPRWKPTEGLTKVCPVCEAIIPIVAKICPHCGADIPTTDKPQRIPSEVEFPEVIEYHTPESKIQYNWVRKVVAYRYRVAGEPWNALIDFKNKFGFLPPKDWMKHSIFEVHLEDRTKIGLFIKHCRDKNAGIKDSELSFWLSIELNRKVTEDELVECNWAEILGVKPDASIEEIRKAYQRNVLHAKKPDDLNYALDVALGFNRIS